MRARLGVHEVISGIMMNRIVDVLVPFTLATLLGASAVKVAQHHHVVAGTAIRPTSMRMIAREIEPGRSPASGIVSGNLPPIPSF